MNLYERVVRVEFENRDDPDDKFTIENKDPKSGEGVKITFQVEKQISTEPNVAYVELYNLSDSTRQKINFRKNVKILEFGHKINLIAGYKGQEKRIFSGVIVSSISSKEGPMYITRINCRNIFYELMAEKIVRTVSKGTLKADFILSILSDIGATIESESIKFLKDRMQGSKFKDTTTFASPASVVINGINEGLVDRINIYFDDVGVGFNPLGVALDVPDVKYAKNSGLIGSPEPNDTGADFKVLLDPALRLNTPVVIDSKTIRAINLGGKYVVKKVTHVGSNRADGPFETRAKGIYENLKLEATV